MPRGGIDGERRRIATRHARNADPSCAREPAAPWLCRRPTNCRGSLYPALQKLLLKGWVKASPAVSETGRQVREYRITASGSRQLDLERQNFTRISHAIMTILETA